MSARPIGFTCSETPETPPESGVQLTATRHDALRLQDAHLVAAARAGERWAAPAIVRRYRPVVRRYLAASFSGNDLDDHMQEVFARCFGRLHRLRDPAALRSFLIGITLRLAGSERRRRRVRRWETLTTTGDLPEPFTFDAEVEARHRAWRTREILGHLRPESCRVLELRFIEGKKVAEVAEALGVSLATAKRQLARASARVRALARYGEATPARDG